MSLLAKLLASQPTPANITLYVPGILGGKPMDPAQLASAMHAGQDSAGQRAAIQVIEAYAHEALALSTQENMIQNGMAGNYLMAHSWFSNLLGDIKEYTAGRVPDAPIKSRLEPKRPRQHDN